LNSTSISSWWDVPVEEVYLAIGQLALVCFPREGIQRVEDFWPAHICRPNQLPATHAQYLFGLPAECVKDVDPRLVIAQNPAQTFRNSVAVALISDAARREGNDGFTGSEKCER